MKHAGEISLQQLRALLDQLRKLGLEERRPGVFYRKRAAFLHFHEDARGLFADLKAGSDWKRFPVNSREGQRALLAEVQRRSM